MASVYEHEAREVVINADGSIEESIKKSTSKVSRIDEPSYIKIYTQMWCEFNQIPIACRSLFLELASRMTYCSTSDLGSSQVVSTGEPYASDIMRRLGIKKRQYQKMLAALCACGAIRKIQRGVYQISPSYAGKGEWKYNPTRDQGGIEDLVATFSFKDGTVDTNIIWGDDGKGSPINRVYRDGLGVSASEKAVLMHKKFEPSVDFEEVDT